MHNFALCKDLQIIFPRTDHIWLDFNLFQPKLNFSSAWNSQVLQEQNVTRCKLTVGDGATSRISLEVEAYLDVFALQSKN